ncbi:MAG: hypothetical protein JW809_06375 [Pirellulales bacterium]|nr:hypothetical protein [Pirellulales bacterium]
MPRRAALGLAAKVVMAVALVPLESAAGAETTATVAAPPARGDVRDVALEPGGLLRGRVAPSSPGAAAPRRVYLIHQGRVVSEALSDAQGRFLMQRLSGGTAALAVDDAARPDPRAYRLWLPRTAPPGALAEASVPTGVVRTQNASVLTMGFPRAAALTGIAAGAVSAPIIYHNIQQNHKPPAPISP